MIFENPFAEEIISEFFEKLKNNRHDPFVTFKFIVDKYLSPKDIERFSTPNFMRILEFISDQKFKMSNLSICNIRSGLNNIGRDFVQERVETARKPNN